MATFQLPETMAKKIAQIVGALTCTIDIETLGRSRKHHALVAIGAAIQGLTADGEILTLETIELCGGFVGSKRFERDCMKWWMNDALKMKNGWDPLRDGPCAEIPKFAPLIYSGPLSESEREVEMVMTLRSFVDGWYSEACARGLQFIMCSDNPQYDLGWLDGIAVEHDIPPFNYGPDALEEIDGVLVPVRGNYLGCIDPTDMARGFLMNPECVRCLSLHADVITAAKSGQIWFLYTVALPKVMHNHRPWDDAITIGWHYHAIDGITRGIFDRTVPMRSMTPKLED
jgi:hypothetical protein